MKTTIIAAVAFLFIGTSAFSQSLSIGIKGGANIGKISGHAFKDEFSLGYHIGGFVTLGFGEKWAIQPEVLFNQTNTDTSSSFSDIYNFNHIDKIKLQSLSIPILLNYNVSKLLTLQAGPQFGIALNKDKNLLQNGEDAFKSGNFSLVGGVQLNLLKFRVYGRYVGGLTNLDNVGNKDTWKASAFQLGVGLAL